MTGRRFGETSKTMRQLTDEHIAAIMTYKGFQMGRTAVTDTARRAERKLLRDPALREIAQEIGVL